VRMGKRVHCYLCLTGNLGGKRKEGKGGNCAGEEKKSARFSLTLVKKKKRAWGSSVS